LPENTVLLENTQKLYDAAGQLASEGTRLILLNIITIICGLILVVLIVVDLKRHRWGNFVPALLFVVGIIGMIVGFRLLGIVGTLISIQPFAVFGDDTTQMVLAEAKRISGLLSVAAGVGLTAGMVYLSVGFAAIWDNRRRNRREELIAGVVTA
jgi:hypothetical protein